METAGSCFYREFSTLRRGTVGHLCEPWRNCLIVTPMKYSGTYGQMILANLPGGENTELRILGTGSNGRDRHLSAETGGEAKVQEFSA